MAADKWVFPSPGAPNNNKLLGRFPNLELRDRRTPPIDAWSALQEDSLEGALFRSLRQQTEGPERELAARIVRQLLDGQEVAL